MNDQALAAFGQATRCARSELAPQVDVTDRVLDTLRARQPRHLVGEPELLWMGISSLAAACIAWVVFWISAGDEMFFALVQPFVTGFQ